MHKFTILLASLLFWVSPVYSWSGYDYNSGSSIEIEKGNLVRSGSDIEYYDWDRGEYRYGTVESINRIGNSVDVEIYDHDTAEYRTFDMDGGPSYSAPSMFDLPGLPGLD